MGRISKGARVQIIGRIPADLMARFSERCERIDVTKNDAIEGALEVWLNPDKWDAPRESPPPREHLSAPAAKREAPGRADAARQALAAAESRTGVRSVHVNLPLGDQRGPMQKGAKR